MRLITWNCGMAFRKKWSRLQPYQPDIMIVQECEHPDLLGPQTTTQYNCFWTGENRRKGLCVLVDKALHAELVPIDPGRVRFMVPLRIAGQINIIAFWAMNDRQDTMQRYIAQVWTGLKKCEEHLSLPTIVAGDLNWNAAWDESLRGPVYGKMRDVIGLLKDHHTVSVYHALNGLEYGHERDHTYFMYRRPDKPYHIDYVFVPRQLIDSVESFSIGDITQWRNASDHVPLFLELREVLTTETSG